MVACPQCGEHFKNPIITHRRFSGGFSIYPLGTIKCPKCGYEDNSYKFKGPKKGEEPTEIPPQQEQKLKAEETEGRKLDESKYEPA